MEWGHQHIPSRARKRRTPASRPTYLSADAPSMARIPPRRKDTPPDTSANAHMGGGRDDGLMHRRITHYGFDEYCSTLERAGSRARTDRLELDMVQKDDVKRWERTGYFIDKTLDFLVRQRGTPCFVNLWPDDTPWVP